MTNRYTPKTTKITAAKTWNDANDQDGKRASVGATVQLYKKVGTAAGTPVNASEFVNVPTSDGDIKTWVDLPVYENGTAITYYIVETLPAGTEYTKDGDGESTGITASEIDDLGTITVTNSYTPKTTSITAIKHWRDGSDSRKMRNSVVATFHLQKTVDGVSAEIDSVEVGKEQSWTHVWSDLPVYEKGKPITYSVKEVLTKSNGYKSDTTKWKDVANGGKITITNRLDWPSTGDMEIWGPWLLAFLASGALLAVIGAAELAKRKKKQKS